MSCDIPVISVNYGESIELILTYKDDVGVAIDLTSATVSVFESAPLVIKAEATIAVSDAAAGKVRFFLSRTEALKLRKGRNNWFRVQVIYGAESDDVTDQIFVEVL